MGKTSQKLRKNRTKIHLANSLSSTKGHWTEYCNEMQIRPQNPPKSQSWLRVVKHLPTHHRDLGKIGKYMSRCFCAIAKHHKFSNQWWSPCCLLIPGSMEDLLRSAAEASPALIVLTEGFGCCRSFSELIKVRRDVSCDRKYKTARDPNGGYIEVKSGKHVRVLSSISEIFSRFTRWIWIQRACCGWCLSALLLSFCCVLDISHWRTVLTERTASQATKSKRNFRKKPMCSCTMLRSRYISGQR